MITYDYTLQVDEGDEIKTYTPSLPKSVKNISLISGPNSAGKSTLMNIIAAGMFGDELESVNQNIRGDIHSLINSNHKKLKFNINIESPDKSIALRLTKNDFDSKSTIEESLNGKEFTTLTKDEFVRKYNLIYDIPDDPRTRIKKITKVISGVLTDYEYDVKSFGLEVTKKLKEIKEKAKEEDIVKLERTILTKQNEINEYGEKATILEERAKRIAKLKVSKSLIEAKLKEEEKKAKYDEIVRLNPVASEVDKKALQKYEADCKRIMANINLVKIAIDDTVARLMRFVSDDDLKIVNKLQRLDFTDALTSRRLPDNCMKAIDAANRLAEDYSNTVSINDKKKSALLKELLKASKQFEQYSIDVPGYGSIKDFIKNLENESIAMSASNHKVEEATLVMKSCKDIKIKLFNLENDINKLVSPSGKIDSKAEQEKEMIIVRYRTDYQNATREKNDAMHAAERFGVDYSNINAVMDDFVRNYPDLTKKSVDELKNELASTNDELASLRVNYDTAISALPRLNENLKKMKAIEDHPLKDRLSDVKAIEMRVQKLMAQIIEMKKKQSLIESGSYGTYSPSDNYITNVWKYLGQRMGTVNHINGKYQVESVNTVDGVIITTTGKKIYISDMGTGQTQMTYLKSLLSNKDGRVVIALFDEVSTMTRSTLNLLFDEFITMQEKNELLVGITVQPNDEGALKIEEMGA